MMQAGRAVLSGAALFSQGGPFPEGPWGDNFHCGLKLLESPHLPPTPTPSPPAMVPVAWKVPRGEV